MNVKKARRISLTVILSLLVLWLLILMNSRIRMKKDKAFLKENGCAQRSFRIFRRHRTKQRNKSEYSSNAPGRYVQIASGH